MHRQSIMDESLTSFIPDRDRAPTALAIIWTWCALSILIVGLRVFTRVTIVRQLGIDDYFILLTLVGLLCKSLAGKVADVTKTFSVQISAIFTAYAKHGGCRHIFYLSDSQKVYVLRLNWLSQPFCVLALITGKISVALLILRMLAKVQKWQRWFLYAVIASVTVVGLVNCLLQFAQCSPPRALWTPSIAMKSRCWAPKILTAYSMWASGR